MRQIRKKQMKRSEMLENIASVIRDTFLLNDSQQAEAILNKIESLGMKPPIEEVCPVLFTSKQVWEKEGNE